MTTRSTRVMNLLRSHGIVPVIRFDMYTHAERAVRGLREVGFTTFEITMSVPGALDLIKDFADQENCLIGAGTVLSLEQGKACIEAGSRYIVTPCQIPGLPELCQEADVPCLMSGLTPNEVFAAHKQGASAVKVFPASSVGGPAHLRALKSVFPEIDLVPTGGVNLHNLADYFHVGASFVGVGSDLVHASDLEHDDLSLVRKRARPFLDLFTSLQKENS